VHEGKAYELRVAQREDPAKNQRFHSRRVALRFENFVTHKPYLLAQAIKDSEKEVSVNQLI
jgi:hypothetical protein